MIKLIVLLSHGKFPFQRKITLINYFSFSVAGILTLGQSNIITHEMLAEHVHCTAGEDVSGDRQIESHKEHLI